MMTYWSLSRAIYIQFNYNIYRSTNFEKITKLKRLLLPPYLTRIYDGKKI